MDYTNSDCDEFKNIKVILLGNSGVGKTTILWKYNNPIIFGDEKTKNSEGDIKPTIGYEYITVKEKVEKSTANVHIWDTTGQDRFNSIASNYYRRCSGAICVYDVTDRESFNSIQDWVDQLKNYSDEEPVLLLIGNKCDKKEEIDVMPEEGERLAISLNAAFYETSALTGFNIECIDKLIQEVLSTLHKRSMVKEGDTSIRSKYQGASFLSMKTHTTKHKGKTKKNCAC
ncbi:unnamed protein product [Moneuplotes crassus]|uniref:Uncharacterized protein n=1 Tax=Euplotes crassus TaxID=5936 RepID=A0AAD1XVN7_EUPCR|nr:unnamed protein product [Moneuplotes crassus]